MSIFFISYCSGRLRAKHVELRLIHYGSYSVIILSLLVKSQNMYSVLTLTSNIKHTGNLDAETHPVLHILWFQ
jgi:hypothetical protein